MNIQKFGTAKRIELKTFQCKTMSNKEKVSTKK